MRIVKNFSKLLCCYCLLWASGANATAFSFADVYIDLDSISITGLNPNDIVVGLFDLNSTVELNDENGSLQSIEVGDENLFNSVSGLNAEALSEGLATNSITNSIVGDLNPASSSAELSILIPFTSYSNTGFDIQFDYELLVTAETENTGDFSIATAGIEYSLLDDNLNLLGDMLTDDVLAIGFDGTSEVDSAFGSFGTLGFDYLGLASGNYYVAINIFSNSFTEANNVVANVPAPGTLFLSLFGLFLLKKKKLFHKQTEVLSPLAMPA